MTGGSSIADVDAAIAVAFSNRRGAPAPNWLGCSPSVAELGFTPRHRLDWSDGSGAVQVACWHNEEDRGAGAWHEQDGAVGFVAGSVRWRGEDWYSPTRWARHLVAAAPSRSLDDLHDQLRGLFVAGYLSAAGDGWLMTDVMGMRLLYWGEDEDVTVISSRAALVAEGLARFRDEPPRDDTSACWLAFTGFRVGNDTGYQGVQVAPQGAHLLVHEAAPTWVQTNPLVVDPGDELRSCTVGELGEILYEDVAESLRAALSYPAERHIIRLTGGKDSRLVLAVALRAGLASEFTYETIGPPDLADVQIASELCHHFSLEHEVGFLELGTSEPFASRFRRFVERTGCMVNGREFGGHPKSPDLRLTGLCGELLRTYRKLPDANWTTEQLAKRVPRSQFGQLGLLRGDLADDLYARFLDKLANEPSPAADPLDRFHMLYAGSRMRFVRGGAREELSGDSDVVPLYSRTAVRAAMALDSRDRQSELLFAEVMRMASERLVRHRFTDPGWDTRASAHLDAMAATDPSAGSPAGNGAAVPDLRPTTLMATLHSHGATDRIEFLTDVLADAPNRAWDLVDRGAALRALDRYASLTNRQRRELFGAASIAVWLG